MSLIPPYLVRTSARRGPFRGRFPGEPDPAPTWARVRSGMGARGVGSDRRGADGDGGNSQACVCCRGGGSNVRQRAPTANRNAEAGSLPLAREQNAETHRRRAAEPPPNLGREGTQRRRGGKPPARPNQRRRRSAMIRSCGTGAFERTARPGPSALRVGPSDREVPLPASGRPKWEPGTLSNGAICVLSKQDGVPGHPLWCSRRLRPPYCLGTRVLPALLWRRDLGAVRARRLPERGPGRSARPPAGLAGSAPPG
jgi:hypothetical protein